MKAIQNTAGAILAALALMGSASPAMAELGGDRQTMDTDSDGYVSREEFSASKLSERVDFSSIDADSDGLLSESEISDYAKQNRRDRVRRRNQG